VHVDLHARYGVRGAVPHRGGARLCQPLPVLLGRLQLPAGACVPHRAHPRAGPGRACPRHPRGARVDRALRSP
jgi:hypothetical protein